MFRLSSLIYQATDFWEYQVRRARITPGESRIPEYPVPVGSSWPGPDAHANATRLTSRSAKRRVARKMRKQRGDPNRTRSLDPVEEQEWVEREEERERQKREVERERLAGLVQVAKQRYERAVEKLGTFTGEPAEPIDAGGEGTELAPSTPAEGVGTEDVRSPTRGRSPDNPGIQSDVIGGLSLGTQTAVHPPDSISDDDSQPGGFFSNTPGNTTQRLYRSPSPPTPEGIMNRYVAPTFRSGFITTVPRLNPWFDDVDDDTRDYSAPSLPSTNSADEYGRWRPDRSVSPSPIRGHSSNPLLSSESRHLAEETSVVLELLSRTGEIDIDDDSQKKSIEQAFENVVKLRREYQVTLASRAGEEAPVPTPDEKEVPAPTSNEEWDGKCVICYDDIANIVLIPCHHMVMCEVGAPSLCNGV